MIIWIQHRCTKATKITTNANNNIIISSKGKDVFVYNDVITDYKIGQDTIQLANSSITSATLNGSNVVFTTDKGNKTSQVYGDPTLPAGVTLNSTKTIMTVTDKFTDGIIDPTNYAKVKKVNASKLITNVSIVGGVKAVG